MAIDVIVLAAGKGTGMKSDRPKVLLELAGRPILHHVLDTVIQLPSRTVAVVVGYKAEEVIATTPGEFCWVKQQELLGTGHAALLAMPYLPADGVVLITYGSTPFVEALTLRMIADAAAGGGVGIVTADLHEPTTHMRVVRDDLGEIVDLIEHSDACERELQITEAWHGIIAAPKDKVVEWLSKLTSSNAAGEYQLGDIIRFAVKEGVCITGVRVRSPSELLNVGNGHQLAKLERIRQRRLADELINTGVQVADPDRIDIRGHLTTGANCFIDVNVIFNGNVELGHNVKVGAGAVLTNSSIGDNSVIKPHTVLANTVVQNDDAALNESVESKPKTASRQLKKQAYSSKGAYDYDVFLCHAHEDKTNFVRSLADALKAAGYRVWYDEFTLEWGDRLRRSIDEGLRSSRFGIVVLSPHFFKKRWPQKELDGLTALELDDGRKRILPVWHNLDASVIQHYAPTLADVIGIPSEEGIESMVAQLSELMLPRVDGINIA